MVEGKLSSQLMQGRQERATRTERKVELRQQRIATVELKAQVESASEKLSQAKSVEEYTQLYGQLPTNIQPFFKTPSALAQEKTMRIEANISKVQGEIQAREKRLNELMGRYEQERKDIDERYRGRSHKGKSDDIRRAEEDFEEQQAEINGELVGLQEGVNALKRGEDVQFENILDFASQKGQFESDKVNARQQNKKLQREFTAKLEAGIKAGGMGTFEKPLIVQEIDKGKVTKIDVIIGGITAYTTRKPSELYNAQKLLNQEEQNRQLQKDFESSLKNLNITEPTIIKKETIFTKAKNVVEDFLSATFFKGTLGLAGKTEPTALSTAELEQKRMDILLSRVSPLSFGGTISFFQEYQFSKELRESGEEQIAIRDIQAKAVEDASKNIETLTKSYEGKEVTFSEAENFNNQIIAQANKLAGVGVRTKIEDIDGEKQLIFSSKSFELDLNPPTVKLLSNKKIIGQGAEVIGALGTEALEFGLLGYLTGGTGIFGKLALKGEKLAEFLKISQRSMKIAKIGAGAVGVGYVGYQAYEGGRIGYETGKEAGVGIPTAIIFGGKPLTEVFAFGKGYKLATVGFTPSKLELQQLKLKEYEREIKVQQLKNIRDFGQFSDRAIFKTNQIGLGQKITPARRRELGLVLEQELGLRPQDAKTIIKQASIFEQELNVKTPFKETFSFKKVGIDVSVSTPKFSRQLAFEFKESGKKITDFTIKASVSGKDKRFAMTQIFKKGRTVYDIGINEKGEIARFPKIRFNLEKVLATKVGKFKSIKLDEYKTLSAFDYETRLIKGKDILGKNFGRLKYKDVLKIGLENLQTKIIKEKFFGAGKFGKVDIGKGFRLEMPYFRGGKELKVANLDEFMFNQRSVSKPSLSMKKLVHDIEKLSGTYKTLRNKRIEYENLQRVRTPLSKTFQEQENFVKSLNVKLAKPKKFSLESGLMQKKVKEVNINALIKDISIRVSGTKTRTKGKTIEKYYSAGASRFAQLSSLALVERSMVANILKENQLERLGLRIKSASASASKYSTRLRQDQLIKQLQIPKLTALTTLKTTIIRTPTFKLPPPRNIKIPRLALIFGIKGDLKRKGRGRKKGADEDLFAFVESFTARALELKPLIIKKQNVNKLIKEFSSPFVIRQRVVIK